jgi:hypothetical protein
MPLESTPAFQRAMLQAQSRASMRGNRAKTGALHGRLSQQDLARKAAFGQLARQQQRYNLGDRGRSFELNLQKDALKKRKKALPLTMGIGAGTALLSAMEGRRRAGLLEEQTAKTEAFRQKYEQDRQNYRNMLFPLMRAATGNYRRDE